MDNQKPRPQQEWILVKDWEQDGIVVRLQRSGYYYSCQVGRKHATEDRIIPYLPIKLEGTRSLTEDITLQVNYAEVVCKLLHEVQQYVLENALYNRANRIDLRVDEDERKANFGKPKTRHTGKTERTREKKRLKAS